MPSCHPLYLILPGGLGEGSLGIVLLLPTRMQYMLYRFLGERRNRLYHRAYVYSWQYHRRIVRVYLPWFHTVTEIA